MGASCQKPDRQGGRPGKHLRPDERGFAQIRMRQAAVIRVYLRESAAKSEPSDGRPR